MRSTVCLAGTVIMTNTKKKNTKKKSMPTEDFATPILDMEQTRVDFEMGRQGPLFSNNNSALGSFGNTIESVNLRVGINDYEHSEIEPDGEVATLFKNEAFEARLEFVHAFAAAKNVWGLQFTEREFSVSGEEAFVPPVDQKISVCSGSANRSLTTFPLKWG